MKKKNIRSYFKSHVFIIGFILTVLLTSFGYGLSLKLSLYGDDWLRLYVLRYMFDTGYKMSYFSIWSYLGPYNFQYPILYFIRLFWGYNPVGYFLTSLILRIIGSVSFYFPLSKLTKSTFLGWAGTIIIATTPIGIQVTDWVFYMNTYLAIIFLGLAFYYLLLIEDKPTFKNQLYIFLFYALFIFIIPVRSYGFFFTLVILSFIKIIWQKETKRKLALIQLIGSIFIYITAKLLGSLGPTTDVLSYIQNGIKIGYSLILHHNYSFIYVPFIDLGNILFPDMLFSKIHKYFPMILQLHIIYYILIILILGLGYGLWNKVTMKNIIIWSFVNISVIPLVQYFFNLTNSKERLSTAFGLWIVVNIVYYVLYKKNKLLILILFLFIICFSLPYYLLPWIFDPTAVFTSDHRYLYFPVLGVISSGIVIVSILMRNRHLKLFVIGFLVVVVFTNIISDTIYFRGQLQFRSEQRQAIIFTSLHKIIPKLPKDYPTIFYITDNTGLNSSVYTFGFPFYMGLSYGISDTNNLPFIILNLDQLGSAISNGKSLKLYTHKIKKADKNKIIYLRLLSNDTFIDDKNRILHKVKLHEQ